MRGTPITEEIKENIVALRKQGFSINEISVEMGRSKSLISRYIQGVKIQEPFLSVLKSKQGASRTRSINEWEIAKTKAKSIVRKLGDRDFLLILASVYWGEGTKREANIINGDLMLLKTFVKGVLLLGAKKKDFKISIRVFGQADKYKLKRYWLKQLDLPGSVFIGFEMVEDTTSNRLPYGMCRIRVTKGGRYFKVIMSLIDEIKLQMLL